MSENTHHTSRTVAALGAAVDAELDATYTLVYHDGSTLPKDVVAALVKGENEWETKGGESLNEWANETAYPAACRVVDELAKEITRRWERQDDADYTDLIDHDWPVSDERQSALDTVLDRDQSTWFTDMIKQHGAVLLRVGIATMDEDAGLSYSPLSVDGFLDLLGFEHTSENRTLAADVLNNASPEYGVAMGYALLGVDLADIVELPSEGKVELRNPHVWLGSPFAGSGWCSEEPFTGTLTVDRGDLRTDDDAFGYSWDDVVGGTCPSYFASGSLVAVATPEPPPTEPTPAGH